MRQFTIFTFLYLAAGVFLAATCSRQRFAIAFKCPDKILIFNAEFLYVLAILSTFLVWHQSIQHSQDRRHNKPALRHTFVPIALTVSQGAVVAISDVFDRGWTIEVILF
jgi:hypothetical protein